MDKRTFKAKRIDNGKWIEGWITKQYRKHHRGELITMMQDKYFGGGSHQVDTYTICRPTGLIDLNGNDIWEHDIIELPEGESDEFPRGYVEWDEDRCRFAIRMGYIDGLPDDWLTMDEYNWEVIGNTFDNRDLLEMPDFDFVDWEEQE